LLQGKFDEAEKWAKKIVDSGQADHGAKQMLQAAKDNALTPELIVNFACAFGTWCDGDTVVVCHGADKEYAFASTKKLTLPEEADFML